SAQASWIVQGKRFSLAPSAIGSVFPPDSSNGSYEGSLAHVVLNRRTLPWERSLSDGDPTYGGAPWLAVLVFDEDTNAAVLSVTAKDLVPSGTPIIVEGSSLTGTGTLAETTLSYGNSTLNPLQYGETPDDPCSVIDISIQTFNEIAPAQADVPYLAHIR